MSISKEQLEKQLGFSISNEQLKESEERARGKLKFIISRYGNANGNRLKPEYFMELVYEDVIMNILSNLTMFLTETMLNMEKECPANSQSTQIDLPYSSIDLQKNQ